MYLFAPGHLQMDVAGFRVARGAQQSSMSMDKDD
jgi:hypothetical protein